MPTTPTTDGELPTRPIADRFVVESLAGRGGMGVVYRARDNTSGALAAVKLVTTDRPDVQERFRREADILRELSHPAIVRYLAHGSTADGRLFLAMEWLEGEDLACRLERQALTVADSVALTVRVADALGAAHARGVVHRDVKPTNLFLPARDVASVKVLDFGVARTHRPALTTLGGVVGTAGYMAPEQARGQRDTDARADVFALGCVLFECLTRRPAFDGEHIAAVLAKILFDDPPRLSEANVRAPAALEDLLGRMLAKDRRVRPADGATVAAELGAIPVADLARTVLSEPPLRSVTAEPRASLTYDERCLACVVMAGASDEARRGASRVDVRAGAPWARSDGPVDAQVAALVRSHAGQVEWLVDGSVVAIVSGQGSATDQAARAATCAMDLRVLLPDAPIALVTGSAELGGPVPVGPLIDRAAALSRAHWKRTALDGIRVDELTAGLLDSRFRIAGKAPRHVLVREGDPFDMRRKLLGQPSPFVGRSRELALLAGAFEACVAESHARVELVTAPAGVGKSRLRYELLRTLSRGDPVEAWSARGDPTSAGAPFALLAGMLRSVAAVRSNDAPEARTRKVAARVRRHVGADEQQRVAEFLGELVGAPFADDTSPYLRAARRDPIVMADQVRRAFAAFLRAETRAHPVVVVLEDLHWGDRPSVACLDAALRDVKDRPWMILALGRPEVRSIFPDLWAGRGLTHTELRQLPARAAATLVRAVLPKTLGEDALARIVQQAEGNALFLEELVRAYAAGKGSEAPRTILAMVQARLEGLDAAARRTLRAASVFGETFWAGGVAKLLGCPPSEVMPVLVGLVDKELVEEHPGTRFPGEREYVFRHPVVREAAYAALTEGDRALGHGLAGEWLEDVGEYDAVAVAGQYQRGGKAARAIEWHARAADEALAANDFDTAIACAARGIECGADGPRLGSLHVVRSDAYAWKSDHARSLEECTMAAGLYAGGSDAWYAAVGRIALECRRLGRPDEAARWAEALLASWDTRAGAPLPGAASAASMVAACHAGETLLVTGRHALAERLMTALELRCEGLVDPEIAGHIERARAARAHLVDRDPSAYAERLGRSIAAFETQGDLRNACIGRANRGFSLLVLGAYEESETELRSAMDTASRLGLKTLVAVCQHNLGAALGRAGRVEEGIRAEREAVDAFAAQSDARLEAASRAYLAELLLDASDAPGALREAERAVDLTAKLPPTRAQALAILAKGHLAVGALAAALEAARGARALLDELGALESWNELVRLMLVEAALASGDQASAREAARTARDQLLARAERLGSPEARARFLEGVRECRRTLDLARSLLD